jgi:hypothetical protein
MNYDTEYLYPFDFPAGPPGKAQKPFKYTLEDFIRSSSQITRDEVPEEQDQIYWFI